MNLEGNLCSNHSNGAPFLGKKKLKRRFSKILENKIVVLGSVDKTTGEETQVKGVETGICKDMPGLLLKVSNSAIKETREKSKATDLFAGPIY